MPTLSEINSQFPLGSGLDFAFLTVPIVTLKTFHSIVSANHDQTGTFARKFAILKSTMTFYFSPEEVTRLTQLGVHALFLFGSQAQNVDTEKSDVDVAVMGKKNKEVYDVLYDLLSGKVDRLVDIDIVFLFEAPMELLSHVATYGIVLYQDTPTRFADFREQVMNTSADFAPLRKIFQQATLARI